MSTNSHAMLSPETQVGTALQRPGQTLKSWWIAYLTWRLERFAIRQLRSMSDRELQDIGVCRGMIEFAVKAVPNYRAVSTFH